MIVKSAIMIIIGCMNASVIVIKIVMMNVSALNVIENVTKIGIGAHGVIMIFKMTAVSVNLIFMRKNDKKFCYYYEASYGALFLCKRKNHALAKSGYNGSMFRWIRLQKLTNNGIIVNTRKK